MNNTIEKTSIQLDFANFLAEKRKAYGMSYRKFSEHIFGTDKKYNHLFLLEKGKEKPTLQTFETILNKLNCRLIIEEL